MNLSLLDPRDCLGAFPDILEDKITSCHPNDVVCVAEFNRQGNILFLGRADGSIAVWDFETRKENRVLNGGHSAPIVSLSLLHNGRFLASLCSNSFVTVWDVARCEKLFQRQLHNDRPCVSIQFSPKDRNLFLVHHPLGPPSLYSLRLQAFFPLSAGLPESAQAHVTPASFTTFGDHVLVICPLTFQIFVYSVTDPSRVWCVFDPPSPDFTTTTIGGGNPLRISVAPKHPPPTPPPQPSQPGSSTSTSTSTPVQPGSFMANYLTARGNVGNKELISVFCCCDEAKQNVILCEIDMEVALKVPPNIPDRPHFQFSLIRTIALSELPTTTTTTTTMEAENDQISPSNEAEVEVQEFLSCLSGGNFPQQKCIVGFSGLNGIHLEKPEFIFVAHRHATEHKIFVYNISNGSLAKILEGHKGSGLTCAVWHPNRPLLFSTLLTPFQPQIQPQQHQLLKPGGGFQVSGISQPHFGFQLENYQVGLVWSKSVRDRWGALMPGYIEISRSVLYEEREDEYDRGVMDARAKKEKYEMTHVTDESKIQVDILTPVHLTFPHVPTPTWPAEGLEHGVLPCEDFFWLQTVVQKEERPPSPEPQKFMVRRGGPARGRGASTRGGGGMASFGGGQRSGGGAHQPHSSRQVARQLPSSEEDSDEEESEEDDLSEESENSEREKEMKVERRVTRQHAQKTGLPVQLPTTTTHALPPISLTPSSSQPTLTQPSPATGPQLSLEEKLRIAREARKMEQSKIEEQMQNEQEKREKERQQQQNQIAQLSSQSVKRPRPGKGVAVAAVKPAVGGIPIPIPAPIQASSAALTPMQFHLMQQQQQQRMTGQPQIAPPGLGIPPSAIGGQMPIAMKPTPTLPQQPPMMGPVPAQPIMGPPQSGIIPPSPSPSALPQSAAAAQQMQAAAFMQQMQMLQQAQMRGAVGMMPPGAGGAAGTGGGLIPQQMMAMNMNPMMFLSMQQQQQQRAGPTGGAFPQQGQMNPAGVPPRPPQ